MPARIAARCPRWLLLSIPMLLLLVAAQVGSGLKPVAAAMTESAQNWLRLLSDDEKKAACFPFESSERTAWYFVPLQDKDKKPTRKGLRLEVMNDAQKQAALALVRSALSDVGYRKVETIMSLESVLSEQEKGRGPVRNPGWYFVTLFGNPSVQGNWGWRIEGHHLSLNLTIKDGKVASITPAFFGSNPGEVKEGPRQGTRPLATSLDNALSVIKSLNDEQQKAALQNKPFPEVQGQTVSAKLAGPVGVRYEQLQPDQQKALQNLVSCYLENFHPQLQQQERDRIAAGGWDAAAFAYSGTTEPGTPITYRLHAPNLLIEFINSQADGAGNKNNHYHTSWRTLPSDFGMTTK